MTTDEVLKVESIISNLQAEIERLREIVRQRTKLLDDQLGTPCEQIRHEQEIERLRSALITAAHWMPEAPITPDGKADLQQVREALGWIPADTRGS